MKTVIRGGAYLLLFVLMSVLIPHLFKQMPFWMLPLLLIAAVLVMRQDLYERLHS